MEHSRRSLHPTGASQLDWISDRIVLPIAALELTFGVLGDLFGRKKLLVSGTSLPITDTALDWSASASLSRYPR